jgi:hypothetical protein
MSLEEQISYWKNRCLLAEEKLEYISYIPKSELISIASSKEMDVNELKYKASLIFKNLDHENWKKMCKEAKESDDQIYFWKLKVIEAEIITSSEKHKF